MFFYFFLAGFGVWKVLFAGMEWWRNHSSDCRSHVSPSDHEDGCMGGQCLCLWTGPSALWWWLSSDGVVFFCLVSRSMICHHGLLLTWKAVRDVANWSPRMREPMEKMYGAEAFAKMWEAWVDGISQFAKRSKGTEVTLFQIHDTNEVVQPLFFFSLIFLT